MAGLETILEKIAKDSDNHCADIIAAAQKEADAMREHAREQGRTAASAMLARTQTQADIIIKRANSSAQTIQSRAVLTEKVAIINEVLEQAATRIKELPDAEYAHAIKTLAVKYAKSESGIICLSKTDAARLPAGFEEDLNASIAEKGGSLKMETTLQNPGGFILKYGDIEQNCTFEALIEAKKDELKDMINQILFG